MKTVPLASLTLALTAYTAVPAALASPNGAHFINGDARHRGVAPRPVSAPMLNLAGRVVLPDGSPAAMATVYLSWMTQNGTFEFASVPVDAGGNFKRTARLASPPASRGVGVTAFLADRGSAWFQSNLGAKALSSVILKLQPGAVVEGRLVRADCSPAANTEIHVEALFPPVDPNSRATGQPGLLIAGRLGSAVPRQMPYDSLMRLFPDGIAPALFHAQTDGNGRFRLIGLPRRTTLLLRPGNGLVLTPNSMTPLPLDGSERQNCGVLVATRTGTARIHVIDALSHKPAPGVAGVISILCSGASAIVLYHGQPPFTVGEFTSTDSAGLTEVKNLLPGRYRVAVEGRVQEIRVPEGQPAAPAEFTLRQGPLNGRLLDSSGRPLANVEIMSSTSSDVGTNATPVNGMNISSFNGFSGRRFGGNWERTPVARTGADGAFALPVFPWGASHVIVRATKGNDRAEYIGAVSAIGSRLEMRMKPGELVSVTGRLVDPHRRPVANIVCQALHWQNSPRRTWFGSAHVTTADAGGRFRVDAVERGESFSIISNGQRRAFQQQAQVRAPSMKTVSLTPNSPISNFESPRFVAKREGMVQDLGDIMVHPSSNPEEVLQSYGAARREVVSAGVIEAPAQPIVAQAEAALSRYYQALRTGDVRDARLLTSRLSPDYAAALPEFLMRAGLTGIVSGDPQTSEVWRALRFVPRSLIRMVTVPGVLSSPFQSTNAVIQVGGGQTLDGIEGALDDDVLQSGSTSLDRGAVRDAPAADAMRDADNEWVVLTAHRHGTVALAGVLHFEAGQWRVVWGAMTPTIPITVLAGILESRSSLKSTDYITRNSAVPMEQFALAREVGTRYLSSWADNRPEALRKETSRFSSSYAPNVEQFMKTQEARTDQGICPLNPGNRISLQPITGLTIWEQKWLAHLAHTHGLSTQFFNAGFQISEGDGPLSDDAVRRGDVVLLQYAAPTGRFVMTLVRDRSDGHSLWKVLEPALPL